MNEKMCGNLFTLTFPEEQQDGKHFLTIRFEDGKALIEVRKTLLDKNGKLTYPRGYSIPIPKKGEEDNEQET